MRIQCALAAFFLVSNTVNLFSSQVALRAERLIDGLGGPPIAPAIIVIDGERIVAVGTDVQIPASAEVLAK